MRRVGQVARNGHGPPPLGLDILLDLSGVVVLIGIVNGNVCTFSGEGNSCRASDSAVTTGDQRAFCSQLAGAAV